MITYFVPNLNVKSGCIVCDIDENNIGGEDCKTAIPMVQHFLVQ